MDEHRVGLQPILRRVWARKGERLRVPVRPRYEWLYVYAFVCPETGETEFWLAPSVSSAWFTEIVSAFLRGREHAVMLVLDQAGWHVSAETLAMEADGVLAFEHLPARSPERSVVRPTDAGRAAVGVDRRAAGQPGVRAARRPGVGAG